MSGYAEFINLCGITSLVTIGSFLLCSERPPQGALIEIEVIAVK